MNQVQRDFNGLGQLITEYQAHGAAVDVSSTPKVQYGYSEMSGGANHSRMTSMSYPNGRVITSDYGASGGLDDSVSRLNSLKDGSTTLESYNYLGLGTVVERLHPESGVDLYTGLDQFGRVVNQSWHNGSTAVDSYQYGYDRNSNRTFRDNVVNTAFGEVYSYDGLNQLVDTQRGTLDSSKTGITGTPSQEQNWSYDALGNWNGVTTNGTTQTRTHNQQNEITAVSGATTPTYNANGNMTKDETGKQFVYDAWNFLKQVKNSSGSVQETFNYDAMKRKIQIVGSSTTDLYYSAQWQVIEERASGIAVVSYVWSPVYVDAMISRDRYTDANGTLDERLYVLHDANFNVTGLVNTSGTVVERFTYEPFGKAEVRDASWAIKSGGSGYAWLYLHQGGRFDSVSGLYAFRFREYSPTLGRWMTNDPIGYESGDLNLYRTNLNNSCNGLDPLGLYSWMKGVIGVAVAGPLGGVFAFDDEIRYLTGTEFTQASATDYLRQLAETWSVNGWEFAASLLQHFLANSGAPYQVQGKMLETVKAQSANMVKSQILAVFSPPCVVGKRITYKGQVKWGTGPFESLLGFGYLSYNKARGTPTAVNDELFYAFGGAYLEIDATITKYHFSDPKALHDPGLFEVAANVKFTDTYTFALHEKPRLLAKAYRAGKFLEFDGPGVKKFNVTASFSAHYTIR